jgi:hypothetical protein
MKRLILLFVLFVIPTGCASPEIVSPVQEFTPTTSNFPLASEPAALPPADNTPTAQTVTDDWQTLVTEWQDALIAEGPGWIHIHSTQDFGTEEVILPNGARLSGIIQEAQWFKIDENGLVVESIYIQRNRQGKDIQVSIFQNGVIRSLTFGDENPLAPYPVSLDHGLLALAQKTTPEIQETQWGNTTALLLIFQEKSSSGTTTMEDRFVVDPQTGQIIYFERIINPESSYAQVNRPITYNLIERADSPTPEILAYLDQAPQGYQPLPPQGVLAPPEFDPSQSKLSMVTVIGDNPERPSQFFGDIYADDYLIGRIDFGAVPGGWCDRSPDGRRIAFTYTTEQPDNSYYETFRWYSLIDRQVIDPFPALELRSNVSWAPDSIRLAFTAITDGDYENRALYVYNTNTGELTRLAPEAAGPWHPHWSPDGNYVVSVVPSLENDNRATLYAVDARSGEIYYQGPFDLDNWQAAPDSPTHEWGITIPNGNHGFERCE